MSNFKILCLAIVFLAVVTAAVYYDFTTTAVHWALMQLR